MGFWESVSLLLPQIHSILLETFLFLTSLSTLVIGCISISKIFLHLFNLFLHLHRPYQDPRGMSVTLRCSGGLWLQDVIERGQQSDHKPSQLYRNYNLTLVSHTQLMIFAVCSPRSWEVQSVSPAASVICGHKKEGEETDRKAERNKKGAKARTKENSQRKSVKSHGNTKKEGKRCVWECKRCDLGRHLFPLGELDRPFCLNRRGNVREPRWYWILADVVLRRIKKVKNMTGRSVLKQQQPFLFPPRTEQMCSQPQLLPDVDIAPSAWAVAACVCVTVCVCVCVSVFFCLMFT